MIKSKKVEPVNPCKNCGEELATKVLTIIDGPCWQCGETMKVAYISSNNYGMLRGISNNLSPSDFDESEIEFAKSKGANLKIHYSKTREESYLANTCEKCGNFAGNHFLFTDYISPAGMGELPSQSYEMGLVCETCN